MRQFKWIAWIQLSLMLFVLSGCQRRSDDVWDDTKTAGRHIGRGFRSLAGKHGDSRQVSCREDFMRCRGTYLDDYADLDFEPLPDQDIAYAHPVFFRAEPGQNNTVPGIEAFRDPTRDPEMRRIFRNVQFPYNSNLVKGTDQRETLRGIATYMNQHPSLYVFVEGHCDERGAEAYNLALGSRRSNAVRDLLIQEGVAPERIFTVSHGKERPLDLGHTEASWAVNRRAEFKVYDSRG